MVGTESYMSVSLWRCCTAEDTCLPCDIAALYRYPKDAASQGQANHIIIENSDLPQACSNGSLGCSAESVEAEEQD